MNSDFPEFERAYDTVLLPEDADRFNHIAAETRFNIYNSPIWRVQGRKFSEALVRECANIALREDHDPYECILRHFGIER